MIAPQMQCSVLCSFEGSLLKVLKNIGRFLKCFLAFFLGFYKGMARGLYLTAMYFHVYFSFKIFFLTTLIFSRASSNSNFVFLLFYFSEWPKNEGSM